MTSDFYFFAMTSPPSEVEAAVVSQRWSLHPRAWEVAIFDWAYLASTQPHAMHAEYQLADALTKGCNLSIGIHGAETIQQAKKDWRTLRACLSILGVAPFFSLFAATHPIDALSNLKGAAADEADPRHRTAKRIVACEEKVEVWWNQAALSVHPVPTGRSIDAKVLSEAASLACSWRQLTEENPQLLVLEDTLVNAPFSASYPQGTLSVWGALEALFPAVSTEVSFRLALYLTQLVVPEEPMEFYKATRKAYALRSKLAHGVNTDLKTERAAWDAAWRILIRVAHAVLRRRGLPDEHDLTRELLEAESRVAL